MQAHMGEGVSKKLRWQFQLYDQSLVPLLEESKTKSLIIKLMHEYIPQGFLPSCNKKYAYTHILKNVDI